MQKPWISDGTALLAVFEALKGNGSAERSSIDRRTGSCRQGWSEILVRLSTVEAALLQDLSWWGPGMEGRLRQLTDVRTPISTDR